jgi:uncharacterized membrane protein
MNYAHIHLLLNHVPVIGAAFALALIFFAVLRNSDELRRASLVAVFVIALIAVPTFLTGEPAGTMVERFPGVTAGMIEAHEGAAEVSLAFLGLAGLMAVVGLTLFRAQRPVPRSFFTAFALLVIVVCGLMAWTANLGGQIRHPEIGARSPAAIELDRD